MGRFLAVYGLGYDMGHFDPFVLVFTQLLHHFLGSKKVANSQKYYGMY